MGWSDRKPRSEKSHGAHEGQSSSSRRNRNAGARLGRYTVYAQRGEELARVESESSRRQRTREVSARRLRMRLDISSDEGDHESTKNSTASRNRNATTRALLVAGVTANCLSTLLWCCLMMTSLTMNYPSRPLW